MAGRARGQTAEQVLVPLTLLRGGEELLAVRAEQAVVAAALAEDPETEVRRLDGAALDVDHVSDLLAPSLFGSSRVLLVRRPGDLPDAAIALLERHASDADSPVRVVVRDTGAAGDASAATRLAKGARVVTCSVKPWEALGHLEAEARSLGIRITRDALQELAASVGGDLLAQATALEQLTVDLAAEERPVHGTVDADDVARYHRGRAETGGFDIADEAVAGDPARALEMLRWALHAGVAELLVVGALAHKLRELGRVAPLARLGVGELASRLRLPPKRVERLRAQARGWTPDGLAAALQAVARADVDVKGGGADSGYAVERAVLAVIAARGARAA